MYLALVIAVILALGIVWLFIRQVRRDTVVRHAILETLQDNSPRSVKRQALRDEVERCLNRSIPEPLFQTDLVQLLNENLIQASYVSSAKPGGEPTVSYRLAVPQTKGASS